MVPRGGADPVLLGRDRRGDDAQENMARAAGCKTGRAGAGAGEVELWLSHGHRSGSAMRKTWRAGPTHNRQVAASPSAAPVGRPTDPDVAWAASGSKCAAPRASRAEGWGGLRVAAPETPAPAPAERMDESSPPRTSRSFGVEGDASSRGFAINLGVWVSSLSPRERAQAGHFCPAYASRYPCSFMNYKQGSGGWALLASARSLSAESGNRSGAGAKAAARRTFSSGE